MSDRRATEEAAIDRVRAAVDGIQAALVRYSETQRTPQANGALHALSEAQQEFKAARKSLNSLVEDVRNGRA